MPDQAYTFSFLMAYTTMPDPREEEHVNETELENNVCATAPMTGLTPGRPAINPAAPLFSPLRIEIRRGKN